MATVTVTLVKDCWIAGVKQTAGSSVTVERSLAAELITNSVASKPANWESSTSGGSEVFAQVDASTGGIKYFNVAGGRYVYGNRPPVHKSSRLFPLSHAGSAFTPSGTVVQFTDSVFGASHRMTTGSNSGDQASFRYRWTTSGPSVDGIGGYILPIRMITGGPLGGTADEIRLLISNNTASGTANVNQISYLTGGVLGEVYAYFPLDKFSDGGTGGQTPYGTIYDFFVSVTCKNAGYPVQIEVGNPLYSGGVRPAISIGVDDGLASTYYELFPLLESYGWRGTVSIAKDYVGTAGYMTEAQISVLYNAGWDIVVHGVLPHTNGAFSTLASLTAEIARNQEYIKERWPGAHEHYTYIGGQVSSNSFAALHALGFKTARLVTKDATPGVACTLTEDAWLRMQSTPVLDATVAARITQISEMVSGKWPALEMHLHSVNGASYETPVENTSRANAISLFDAVLAQVVAGKIDVLTRSEIYRRFA